MTLLADDRDARGRVGHDSLALGTLYAGETRAASDAELLAAVRAGDVGAYAELYELHHSSVRRLARRLARSADEADDVVSEVFANTLRAIQHGGGPRDEFAAYALRSVRNTITKLRTRTDTARATPTDLDDLDRVGSDDVYHVPGDIEQAFAELPERFQQVLWSTAVEGHQPSDLSAHGDAGAAASLSLRARRALGRSYLRVRTQRPTRNAECTRVRSQLPGYVQQSAAAGTVARVETHLRQCPDCAEVHDEMCTINAKLRTIPWFALLAAGIRRVGMMVGSMSAPAAATAAAPVVAIAVAGTLIARHDTGPAVEDTVATTTPVVVDAVATPGSAAGHAAGPAGAGVAGDAAGADDAAGAPAASDAHDVGVTDPATTVVATAVLRPIGIARDPNGTITITTPIDPVDDGTDDPADDGLVDPGDPDGDTAPAGSTGDGSPTGSPGTGSPSDGTDTGSPGTPGSGSAGAPGGVVGDAVGGVVGDVVPAVTDTAGGLLDDVGGTLGDVGGVVGALPNGVPAVVDATGELVEGVVGTVGHTVPGVVDTVGTTVEVVTETVGGVVTVVDDTVAGTVGAVNDGLTDVLTVDPNDPVGDLLGDVAGEGGLLDDLLGPGGVVDGTVGGLLGGGGICLPLPLLPCP